MNRLPTTTSAAIITKFKRHFATHVVPRELISDNADYFSGREFWEFAWKRDFGQSRIQPVKWTC